MTYPNAYDGIKKVFTAQILALIGAGCTLIGAFAGGLGIVAGSLATGISGGVFAIAALVLSILALVFTLVGLSRASKDEEIFRLAFIWSLISLIVSVIGNLMSLCGIGGSALSSIANLIVTILGLIVIHYIFKGIEKLAYNMNREDVAAAGRGPLILLYCAYGVTIFCSLMSLIFPAATILGMLGILSFLASIAMLVGYILYLVHLDRAKKMLMA